MIPIILAGGSGTRFWPLSRRDRPKQLLSFYGDGRSMIQTTVDRLLPLCPDGEAVRIICRRDLTKRTEIALTPEANVAFIEEPAARNTAPAIAYATARLEAVYGDEPLAFFPADHFVAGDDAFRRCLRFAARRARRDAIITLGVPPTRPETGYGYIELASEMDESGAGEPTAHPVEAFVEKPDRRRACEYLATGRHLWNSGIFVFRPSTVWREFERQRPEMSTVLRDLRSAVAEPTAHADTIADAFQRLESISIDYAIMEGASNVEVVPATFRWSDVGHWAALDEVVDTDGAGNVVDAHALLDDVTDCVILSDDDTRHIAASGIDNLVVVDTDDALLIIPKDRAQRVRDLVAELNKRGRDDLL